MYYAKVTRGCSCYHKTRSPSSLRKTPRMLQLPAIPSFRPVLKRQKLHLVTLQEIHSLHVKQQIRTCGQAGHLFNMELVLQQIKACVNIFAWPSRSMTARHTAPTHESKHRAENKCRRSLRESWEYAAFAERKATLKNRSMLSANELSKRKQNQGSGNKSAQRSTTTALRKSTDGNDATALRIERDTAITFTIFPQ